MHQTTTPAEAMALLISLTATGLAMRSLARARSREHNRRLAGDNGIIQEISHRALLYKIKEYGISVPKGDGELPPTPTRRMN